MKNLLRTLAPLWDIILVPFTLAEAVLLAFIRRVGVERMPLSKAIFRGIGVFPIVNHYYEPLFDPKYINRPLSEDRGIRFNLNIDEQLSLLGTFAYADELKMFPLNKTPKLEYFYHNGAFEAGDAEFLYNMVRLYK